MRSIWVMAAAAACLSTTAVAEDFESAPEESPGLSLPATEVSGEDFHVHDPVSSDGLMHHYLIESRFGSFPAYGRSALTVRLREVAALATIARTSDAQVALKSVSLGIQEDVHSMVKVATNPVGVVTGIPRGIGHLLGGYRAQAQEISRQASQTLHGGNKASPDGTQSDTGKRLASQSERLAKDAADHYLGLTAAERRWYAKLGVDPYTDNEVLRNAVRRLAKIDAAASLGMRFAPVGIPFAGEVNRALDVIYNEDPAVLRKRRHEELAADSLTETEVAVFEKTALLNPTRQTLLVEAVKSLAGVTDRSELLRHAVGVTTEEEMEVFLASVTQLVRFHARQPVARIIGGVRIPCATLADGRVVIFGAFDAVYWTRQVAGYEATLREALATGTRGRDVWFTGSVSPRARAELERLGWSVHDHSEAEPSRG